MADGISMDARREVLAAVAERYRLAGRQEKGRILDELTAMMGWHRKHLVRALSKRSALPDCRPAGALADVVAVAAECEVGPVQRKRRGKYDGVRDALVLTR